MSNHYVAPVDHQQYTLIDLTDGDDDDQLPIIDLTHEEGDEEDEEGEVGSICFICLHSQKNGLSCDQTQPCCGAPYHHECLKPWSNTQKQNFGGSVKCPYCNCINID